MAEEVDEQQRGRDGGEGDDEGNADRRTQAQDEDEEQERQEQGQRLAVVQVGHQDRREVALQGRRSGDQGSFEALTGEGGAKLFGHLRRAHQIEVGVDFDVERRAQGLGLQHRAGGNGGDRRRDPVFDVPGALVVVRHDDREGTLDVLMEVGGEDRVRLRRTRTRHVEGGRETRVEGRTGEQPRDDEHHPGRRHQGAMAENPSRPAVQHGFSVGPRTVALRRRRVAGHRHDNVRPSHCRRPPCRAQGGPRVAQWVGIRAT